MSNEDQTRKAWMFVEAEAWNMFLAVWWFRMEHPPVKEHAPCWSPQKWQPKPESMATTYLSLTAPRKTAEMVRQYLLRLAQRPPSTVETGERQSQRQGQRRVFRDWEKAKRTAEMIVTIAELYHLESQEAQEQREEAAARRKEAAEQAAQEWRQAAADQAALTAAREALEHAVECIEALSPTAWARAEKSCAERLNKAADATAELLSGLQDGMRTVADGMGKAARDAAADMDKPVATLGRGRPKGPVPGKGEMKARLIKELRLYLGALPTQTEMQELFNILFGAGHGLAVKRELQDADTDAEKNKLMPPSDLLQLRDLLFWWQHGDNTVDFGEAPPDES